MMFKTVSEEFYRHNYEFVFPLLNIVCEKFDIKIDDWALKSMEESPNPYSYSNIGETEDKFLYISTDRVSIKNGNDYAAFICCHELGHVRQYNDHNFSDVYYRNMNMEEFDYLSRPCEQDATIFALRTGMFNIYNIKDITFQAAIERIFIDRLLMPMLSSVLTSDKNNDEKEEIS